MEAAMASGCSVYILWVWLFVVFHLRSPVTSWWTCFCKINRAHNHLIYYRNVLFCIIKEPVLYSVRCLSNGKPNVLCGFLTSLVNEAKVAAESSGQYVWLENAFFLSLRGLRQNYDNRENIGQPCSEVNALHMWICGFRKYILFVYHKELTGSSYMHIIVKFCSY